ncbi:LysR family transcriptional regulator [Sessilibacter sp. MAH1]
MIFGNMISDNRKPTDDFRWDDIRAFLAVARYGTLSLAANALNIGIATLSRRIERLEQKLDIPLFIRHQTGYKLTQDGLMMLDKAESMEASALALIAGANENTEVSGKVSLATAENLATKIILPNLQAFSDQYPNLIIDLITNINTVNLHSREADLAIRMVRPEKGNLTFRKLGELGYGLYASESYLKQDSLINDSHSGLEKYKLISWHESLSHLAPSKAIEEVFSRKAPTLKTTSLHCQLEAAKSGLGVAFVPHFLAKPENLIHIETNITLVQPIYLVIQTDIAKSARVRILADFLSELITKHAEILRGQ